MHTHVGWLARRGLARADAPSPHPDPGHASSRRAAPAVAVHVVSETCGPCGRGAPRYATPQPHHTRRSAAWWCLQSHNPPPPPTRHTRARPSMSSSPCPRPSRRAQGAPPWAPPAIAAAGMGAPSTPGHRAAGATGGHCPACHTCSPTRGAPWPHPGGQWRPSDSVLYGPPDPPPSLYSHAHCCHGKQCHTALLRHTQHDVLMCFSGYRHIATR